MKYLTLFACLLIFAACAEPQPTPPADPTRLLIVGGNTSHDFGRWFNQEDTATLEAAGYQVDYTEAPDSILHHLANLDVLYLSNNQPLPDSTLRQAIFNFADAGKGLLLVHAALWYSWPDWPAYNRDLAGGGSPSHGPYGPFEVKVTVPDHPIMQGIESAFLVEDELYRFAPDSTGAAMNVLAVGTEPVTGTRYPVVWTIDHPTRRIVCITLGHDGKTHQNENYRALLRHSVAWLMR